MLVFVSCLFAFTIKLTGLRTDVAPPCAIRDAMRELDVFQPRHVHLHAHRRFVDEYVVEATVHARNGTTYCASARGTHFLSAVRAACQSGCPSPLASS